MSKNRDLIDDMAEAPETEDFVQFDSEPLQLGGVGEDAPAANDRQVTTPGDVHVAPQMPTPIDGTLRQFALRVPDVIDACSGIMVFGKRIKSLVFSTDLSIIRNVNADAVFAVYPFTPQPIITQALLLAADIPVFAGVGGGLTKGQRVVNLAMFAEMQGATGVVVNAPTANTVVQHVAETIDIPVVVTVARADTDFDARLQAGACTIEYGFVLDDLLTNYERIADHCSNIAVAMIEVSEDRFDTHEYLNHIKNGESPSFEKRYERYRGRYTFEPGPSGTAAAPEQKK